MTYNPKASYLIHNGDMLKVLPTLTGKFHAVLCDPPYGISFMGKAWDTAAGPAEFQSRVCAWGNVLMPLMLPGALVFMFGGTRMWHRLAAGMEDAGFEMWDTLMWLHGQGFPKGQDISKLLDKANCDERKVLESVCTKSGGWKSANRAACAQGYRPNEYQKDGNRLDVTIPASEASAPWSGHKTCALKPAWEPVLCFRAPSQGKTYAELAQMFGSGALSIDDARIGTDVAGWAGAGGNTWNENNCGLTKGGAARPTVGRYPANLALDEESAALLESGQLTAGVSVGHNRNASDEASAIYSGFKKDTRDIGYSGSGGASRFFYCSKASTAERDGGCENNHPTVKPIDLCEWLATLSLPPSSVPGRRILVPFSGSGSEMIGCLGAGWDEVVGVELDAAYCDIARARIKHHIGLRSSDGTPVPVQKTDSAQPGLF